jgi:hypothetical protein
VRAGARPPPCSTDLCSLQHPTLLARFSCLDLMQPVGGLWMIHQPNKAECPSGQLGLTAAARSWRPPRPCCMRGPATTISWPPACRPNTLTSVPYKSDATIMGWDVLNEPRCPGAPASSPGPAQHPRTHPASQPGFVFTSCLAWC